MGDGKASKNGSYLCDLSAAFNTVDYILLHVVNNTFGIMDTALKWFESCLRPRNFTVNVNGKTLAER